MPAKGVVIPGVSFELTFGTGRRVDVRQNFRSGGSNSEAGDLRRSIVADLNRVTDTAVLQAVKNLLDQHLETEDASK